MTKDLRTKVFTIALSVLVTLSYSALLPAGLALAEGETTSTQEEINWKDPNNWFEQWKAGQEAKKAEAEAAAAAEATNTNTGADSFNESTTDTQTNTDTDINNTANIDNLVNGDSNTGDSSADKNTGDGVVTTGDSTLSGNLETTANTVSVGSVGGCAGASGCGTVSISDLAAANDTTGAGSFNISDNEVSSDDNTNINNDADLFNFVDFDGSSGDNSADKNTGDGVVTTGDSDVILTAINTANNVNVGTAVFNVFDDQTGDIVIDFNSIEPTYIAGGGAFTGNSTTGADSMNSATNTSTNNNTILVDNFGNLINSFDLDSNTGDNTANENTGDGSITTGDANIAFNLVNFLNNVFLGGSGELLLGMVNIFGSLDGDIVLKGINEGTANPDILNPDLQNPNVLSGNSTTGADSFNNSENSLENNTDIDLNNFAEVLNNITLDGNTGDNDASKNTGGGFVDTGDVNSNLNVATVANTSAVGSGGDVWMVLINNMGSWTGQLFGGEQGSTFSPFFEFVVNGDGTITAVNDTTGAGSFNEANNTIENNTDIKVNNTGTLVNNINLSANTGNNSASANTGSGSITTGDTNIAANITNLLNNTFIGGRFLLTIVNIFGGFDGSIGKAGSGVGTIQAGPNTLVAVGQGSPSGSGNNPTLGANVSTSDLGTLRPDHSGAEEKEKDENLLLVAGKNLTDDFTPIARFSADRGIFDGFRIEYLLLPVIVGTVFSISRRAIVRR